MKKSRRKAVSRSRVGRRILDALQEVRSAAASDQSVETMLDVRSVQIVEPSAYDATAVKALRARLGVSQGVFAGLMGVSTELVQNWEQGLSSPRPIARRLMDQINADPNAFFTTLTRSSSRQRVA